MIDFNNPIIKFFVGAILLYIAYKLVRIVIKKGILLSRSDNTALVVGAIIVFLTGISLF